jgi:hypothetical protein
MKQFISLANQIYHYDASEEHFLYQLEQNCKQDFHYLPFKNWHEDVRIYFYKENNYYSFYDGDSFIEDIMFFLVFREIRILSSRLNDKELKLEISCGITRSTLIGLILTGLIYLSLLIVNVLFGLFILLLFTSFIFYLRSKSIKDIKYFVENFLPKSVVSLYKVNKS